MALLGLVGGELLGFHELERSQYYLYAVTVLLAIGLYGSTSGIAIDQLISNRRTILLAITMGVLAKAVVIAGTMLLVVDRPVYALLLGVAVAQIDPLSVAALVTSKRMSDSAKTVLRAWSSFDDPITMLITVYLLALAASGDQVLPAGTNGPLGLLIGLGKNLAFAAVVYGVWAGAQAVARRLVIVAPHRRHACDRVLQVVGPLVLLGAGYYAVSQFALFGLAIIGLFLRPVADALLAWVTKAALLLATVALGLLLAGGVNWTTGIVLGAAAYGAQILLAPVVVRSHSFVDRTYLALGQQNGITAITLALLVEPVFPGTVGIIAPAILTVNALHAGCGTAWEAFHATHPNPAPREVVARVLRSAIQNLFGVPKTHELFVRHTQLTPAAREKVG
jgi:NhaP-type Na+/H+ or K+/H+ antiporter